VVQTADSDEVASPSAFWHFRGQELRPLGRASVAVDADVPVLAEVAAQITKESDHDVALALRNPVQGMLKVCVALHPRGHDVVFCMWPWSLLHALVCSCIARGCA
jgi:hypothetical protein